MEQSEVLEAITGLNAHRTLDELVPAVLDISLQLTGSDRAVLALCGDDRQFLIRAAKDRDGRVLDPESFQGSTTVLRKVVLKKKALYAPALDRHGEFAFSDSIHRLNLHSAVCVPLVSPGSDTVTGALYVDSRETGKGLDAASLQLMQSLANHVAIAVDNARLIEQLQRMNSEVQKLNAQLQSQVEAQTEDLTEVRSMLAETQRVIGVRATPGGLVGKSEPMRALLRVLEKVTRTSASVLITGESGTGKELVARHIHYNGPRAAYPMVSVNCSAFSESLLESELFGHARGAFTGATESRTGLFALANQGSLFLDEVGDMSSEMQKRLLRVLENGEIRPVGSKSARRVDVRIIAATNRDLPQMIRKGRFREDLFFRLNVISLHLPSLRERKEDIPLLVDSLSRRIAEELEQPERKVPRQLLNQFLQYDWPGNVRELLNELRRYFIMDSEYHLEKPTPLPAASSDMKLSSVEKRAILKALKSAHGNKTRAAQLLGIPRTSFYEKLDKLGLK